MVSRLGVDHVELVRCSYWSHGQVKIDKSHGVGADPLKITTSIGCLVILSRGTPTSSKINREMILVTTLGRA